MCRALQGAGGVPEMNETRSLTSQSLEQTHVIRTIGGSGNNEPATSGWDIWEVSTTEEELVLRLER